jgi:hypothetical protein
MPRRAPKSASFKATSPSIRSRRSTHVAAPLLAAAALALVTTGCRQTQPKRCVDAQNRVVDPSFCEVPNQNPNNSYYHGSSWPFHYYYGGSGGYAPGSFVSGGSNVPRAGVSYSTTARGGFGSSFGGGGSDGGAGHGGSGGE